MIVGIVRFSVLLNNAKAWVSSQAEDQAAILFTDERLAARFALFESATLPFMKGETSHFLILISTLLPAQWLQRLHDDIAGADHIHIRAIAPEGSMTPTITKFLTEQRDGDEAICTYRLDDDDAMPPGRTALLTRRMRSGAKIIAHRNGIWLRWNNGLEFTEVDTVGNGVGIASVAKVTDENIYTLGRHTQLPLKYDTYVINTRAGWLRSVHDMADTAGRHNVTWRPLVGKDLEFFAARYPYIDLERYGAALRINADIAP